MAREMKPELKVIMSLADFTSLLHEVFGQKDVWYMCVCMRVYVCRTFLKLSCQFPLLIVRCQICSNTRGTTTGRNNSAKLHRDAFIFMVCAERRNVVLQPPTDARVTALPEYRKASFISNQALGATKTTQTEN